MFINLEFIIFIFVISLTILAINIHVCGVIELVLWLIYVDGYGLRSQIHPKMGTVWIEDPSLDRDSNLSLCNVNKLCVVQSTM